MSFSDSKPHYELLDGLRGVAALLVVWYHVFEGHSFAGYLQTGTETPITYINHGYLAVDFFFILSGFVIGYAYDDRWGRSLTLGNFFKRRLIRLHPMVVMGALAGLVMFFLQGGVKWDGTPVGAWATVLALVLSVFMIPAVPGCGYEVRGNGEMFPLNGPCWSLFFEYIGNIVYALLLRRLPTKALAAVTALLGVGLAGFASFDVAGLGFLSVGWTLDAMNFLGGTLRMLFPFSMGLLLARGFRPRQVRAAFWISTAILLVLFCVPYIPGKTEILGSINGGICLNGLFESACILLILPAIVLLAASGRTTDAFSTRVCQFLGDLSFPLYITHYPVMYFFYDWMAKTGNTTLGTTWMEAVGVVILNVLVAWAALKLYDEPVRRRLSAKFLHKAGK